MRGPTHRIPGLVLTDHTFEVPLDHSQPTDEILTVFAREVVAPEREGENLPWLVFLQGGPGAGSPRPMDASGWLKRALQDHRVLLLDQRGTARSSPVNAETLAKLPDPKAQAEYIRHFRADSIVQDCEFIRSQLVEEPWSLLGQSYGGFCATTYLSFAPQGLRSVYITGGIPPVGKSALEVYQHTVHSVLEKNRRYYQRYPGDVERMRQLVSILHQHDVRLPEGDRLTPRKLQTLGLHFGFSDGFELVHYLLEDALCEGKSGLEPSYVFLHGFEHVLIYNTHPLFSLLDEASYAEGQATQWAAQRVLEQFPEFAPDRENGPILFTGEMTFPWMFEEYCRLKPLAAAAELLAQKEDWPALYDPAVLAQNTVPAAAAVYHDDMYVDRGLSLEVAAGIPNLQLWITNEYEHNALRARGEIVLNRLMAMVQGDA